MGTSEMPGDFSDWNSAPNLPFSIFTSEDETWVYVTIFCKERDYYHNIGMLKTELSEKTFKTMISKLLQTY